MMVRSKCAYDGCNVTSTRRIKENGYCDNHQDEATADPILQRLIKSESDNAALKEEVDNLKSVLKTVCGEVITLYKHLNTVSSNVNRSNYQSDEQEQYGRFESWRINELDELPLKRDANGNEKDDEDCKETAILAAELVGVSLKKEDIQRAHRVGKRRKPTAKNPNPSPRQVIVKLKDSDQRTSIVLNKRKLQENAKKEGVAAFQKAYIAEDLTPFRSKLLWYAKNKCDGKFIKCHTRNGRIKAKLASNPDKKEWITISNPDDFHAHNIDIDIDALNKGMKKFQIMKDFNVPVFSYNFD